MTVAFELAGVGKSHRAGDTQIPILTDINLRIDAGEFVSIVGPSGSGKSTLMTLLGCLDAPTSGRVSVLGTETSQMSDDDLAALRARTLGFVFQSFNLLPAYDALSNVALAMAYTERHDRTERATALLRRLGLQHRLHAYPSTLSGGEKQRVAIARAISNDPAIILADEPTGALDQVNGSAVLELLTQLNKEGKTVILVTHDAGVAARASRVISVVDGRIQNDLPRLLWNA